MIQDLIAAEAKAQALFDEAARRNYFVPGQTEKELNNRLYALAKELYNIDKYWHKRIVRAGANTLLPYRENPENLLIQPDDIMFFDFGPVFEEWEADFGRTYVTGNDPVKMKLKNDAAAAWQQGANYFTTHYATLTGAAFYEYTRGLAASYGWEYGNIHCGHLVGNFPHEEVLGDEVHNYLHPDNHTLLSAPDIFGNPRHWIYEIHFTSPALQIGAFFEQLVSSAAQQ